MAFGWSKSRCSPIGIDLGVDSLKVLQVIPGDPPQLLASAAAVVPEHARTDPAARLSFNQQSLKSLLKIQPFQGRKVILSIPAHQMLIQHLQLPRTDGADCLTQIDLHLRQRLNIESSRLVIRHLTVGSAVRDGSTRDEVICMAVNKDTVMRWIDMLHKVGLEVVGMYAEPQAILKAFSHLFRRAEDLERNTCFIDLGALTTKVVVAQAGQMAFAKIISVGSDQITRFQAKSHNIDFMKAREQRILLGQNQSVAATAPKPAIQEQNSRHEHRGAQHAADYGQTVTTGGEEPLSPSSTAIESTPHRSGGLAVLDAQLAAAGVIHGDASASQEESATNQTAGDPVIPVGDTLDCLLDEMHLCLRYYQSVFPNRPIDKLVFLGGEAHHVSTCQHIARSLRIAAQLGDPMARLMRAGAKSSGLDLRQPQPGWAVPLGLCLSEANV